MREVERFHWAARRGVDEELLFNNMPDDLQRDIRRHLFKFLNKVNIRVGMGVSAGSVRIENFGYWIVRIGPYFQDPLFSVQIGLNCLVSDRSWYLF